MKIFSSNYVYLLKYFVCICILIRICIWFVAPFLGAFKPLCEHNAVSIGYILLLFTTLAPPES